MSGKVSQVRTSPASPSTSLAVATGYADKNTWLDWLVATAISLNMTNCVACSSARPTLFTVPAPLFPSDPPGYHYMLAMTMSANPANCTTLSVIFTPVKNTTIPPVFTPAVGNYSCFTQYNVSAFPIGHIEDSWCLSTVNITNWSNASSMVWARADLFWFCGG